MGMACIPTSFITNEKRADPEHNSRKIGFGLDEHTGIDNGSGCTTGSSGRLAKALGAPSLIKRVGDEDNELISAGICNLALASGTNVLASTKRGQLRTSKDCELEDKESVSRAGTYGMVSDCSHCVQARYPCSLSPQ